MGMAAALTGSGAVGSAEWRVCLSLEVDLYKGRSATPVEAAAVDNVHNCEDIKVFAKAGRCSLWGMVRRIRGPDIIITLIAVARTQSNWRRLYVAPQRTHKIQPKRSNQLEISLSGRVALAMSPTITNKRLSRSDGSAQSDSSKSH